MARFSLASLPLNTESSVPLHFFCAIVFSSPKGCGAKNRLQNLLITLIEAFFGLLTRGKTFLHAEMPSEICFQRPYLCKNQVLMDQLRAAVGFLPCFCGVFSSCRNVFPITFLRMKTKKGA